MFKIKDNSTVFIFNLTGVKQIPSFEYKVQNYSITIIVVTICNFYSGE